MTMKKLFFVLAFLISHNIFCNPTVPLPVISEFFYNEGNWQIELYFSWEWHGKYGIQGFEDLQLVCNSGEALFIDGLKFQWDSIIVIDQTMLASAFFINPDEDNISVKFSDGSGGWHWICEGIEYGPEPNLYNTTGPKPEQSICMQYFYINGFPYSYRKMKQSPPTIGSDPFNVSSRTSFSGFVFDQNMQPVEGTKFVYCEETLCYGNTVPAYACFETDANGYFETDGLFSNWHFFELTKDGYVFMEDIVFMEPDSVYYKEYYLTGVGVKTVNLMKDIEVVTAPNPFSHKTTFHISIPQELDWSEARITIFNMKGQEIDFIPIVGNPWAGGKVILDWVPGNANNIGPGLYLYTMELDGKLIKSEKLIINE
ncbi:MAG: hypothetical protein DRJ15_01220 [Bacteroidetes bacterium]|nr:MAG: hypothetical protein DRJ15_01220 [Bacteroidota bacterium]